MLINFYCNISQGHGYSGAGEHIAVALERMGHDVRVVHNLEKIFEQNLTPEGLAIIKKPIKFSKVGIYFGFPVGFRDMQNEVKIGFTMFETSKLPNGKGAKGIVNDWAGSTGNFLDNVNGLLDELWLPSEHNVELFRSSGVEVPIEKVLLGVNEDLYHDMSKQREETRNSRPFTFLMLGTLTVRKNPGLAITSFMELFKGQKDVKLIVKTTSGTLAAFQFHGDYNVEIIDRYATIEEVQSLYANADAFLFPSRGEGFGLPPLEAMATGLPTIFSDNTGMSEFVNREVCYPIGCDAQTNAVRYPSNWGDVGKWYEPNINDFKAAMLNVYNNQEMSRLVGKKASKWALENFTYKQTAQRITDLLKKYE